MPFYVPPSKASCCLSPTQLGGTDVFYTGPNIPAFGIITNDTLNDVIQKLAVVVSDVYTDEQAQDAVGSILLNTPSVTFTYEDGTPPSIAANIVDAYVLSLINSNVSNNYIQNQALVSQIATSRITGNQAAGSFTALISSVTLASRNTDPTITNGALVYRSDLNKFRGVVNNVWQNIATEDQIPPAILNQNFSAQVASMWISGTARIGAGTDNGGKLQINGGVLSTAPSLTDYPIINGGTFYRSDTNKQRIGINGVWRDVLTDGISVLTGLVVFVDANNPYATDSRVGLSNTSIDRPFRTINAAVQVASNNPSTVVANVYVRSGYYPENISAPFSLYLRLEAGVYIEGTITSNGPCTIIGESSISVASSPSSGHAIATIRANSASPVINSSINPPGGDVFSVLQGIVVDNIGAGQGFYTIRGAIIKDCRIQSATVEAINCGSFSTMLYVENSYIKSLGTIGIYGQVYSVKNSTVIAINHAIFQIYQAYMVVENCKLYSRDGYGAAVGDDRLGGVVIFRNNHCSTAAEALWVNVKPGQQYASGIVEVTDNIMNVRGGGANAFFVRMGTGPSAISGPAVIMNNRYTKAGFSVVVDGFVNTDTNNVGSLAFGPNYPSIE